VLLSVVEQPKVRLDNRPLYRQAEEAMETLLMSGRFRPGDQLPPEPELAQLLGISRSTLREAMRKFEERRIITRKQGVGTFINAGSSIFFDNGLENLESIDRLAERHGLIIETHDLAIKSGTPSEEAAKALNLEADAPVIEVSRTKTNNGRPLAYMVDILPAKIISLDNIKESFKGSVLDFLLENLTSPPSYARADIFPVTTDEELSGHLRVPQGTPIHLLIETLYSINGQQLSYSKNFFLPTFFNFHVIRRVSG
jgi:GntR family transcriptional regulator